MAQNNMSPEDKVERVLKEIHLFFAKSESIADRPDKLLVDKREFLTLLDRLNNGIYDMMETYELTKAGREAAERSFKKKGDTIIEDATRRAEDIYAASALYTTDCMKKIQNLMEDAEESMEQIFKKFNKEIVAQKQVVRAHETDLHSQLSDMADSQKYLQIIDDINRREKRTERDLEAEALAGVEYAKRMGLNPTADIPEGDAAAERKVIKVQREEAPKNKIEVKVNTDAAYFKWKESRDGKETE